MKPTMMQKCGYAPNPANDYEVILDGDLVYEDDDYIIRVYCGFASDGGSIPQIVWTLLGISPFDPRCVYGFFIHDALYGSHLLSRAISDGILDKVLGIPPCCNAFQRWLIWSRLRLYGWIAYNGKTGKQIEECKKFVEVVEKKKLKSTVLI
jgi:hypothetical protein